MDVESKKYKEDIERYEKDNLKNKNRSKGLEIFEGFFFSFVSYLVGMCELPFGIYPFGMSLLCTSDKKVPYILLGVCLSAFNLPHTAAYISAYVCVLLVRVITRLTLDNPLKDKNREYTVFEVAKELFSENICLRMCACAIGAFGVGFYKMAVGGFLYYDLYGSILSLLVSPIVAAGMYGLFKKRGKSKFFIYFSLSLLTVISVRGAKELYFYGVSVAAFVAMLVTLYVCRKKGIIYGIGASILAGLSYSPIYTPIFIFAAIASGALFKVSVTFACIAAFGLGMAWGFYVNSVSSVILLLPSLLAACLLFPVLDKLYFNENTPKKERSKIIKENKREDEKMKFLNLKKEENSVKSENIENTEKTDDDLIFENFQGANLETQIKCSVGEGALCEARLDFTEQKIKNICETFSEISKFFTELGDKMRVPLVSDIRNICDSAFENSCENCKKKGFCWDVKYTKTMESVANISATVHKNGKIDFISVPPYLKENCLRIDDITEEINHNFLLHEKQLLLCDKTEIFALDYEAVANLLSGSMSVEDEEFCLDREMSQRLCKEFDEKKIKIKSVAVYGNRKKKILVCVKDLKDYFSCKMQIISSLQDMCKEEIAENGSDTNSLGETIVYLSGKQKFGVEYTVKTSISPNEDKFCGDSSFVLENGEDRFYSLISDGMGSGRDAALTSGICSMFMKKMLLCGNRCETSLKMLNGFLRNKGGGSMHECSSTVDLFELDLMCGKASFYKSGAAPSYVYRDGSLFKLRSKTVPLGIIKELDAKKISFDVNEGDVIIMVSDGVTQGKDECPWLFDLLKKNLESEGMEKTSELIVNKSRENKSEDDISVIMMKINKI